MILLFLALPSSNLFGQDVCECTNCPLEIVDNDTFAGLLAVQVDGPNDLEDYKVIQIQKQLDL